MADKKSLIQSVGPDGNEILSNILDQYTGEYITFKEIQYIPNIIDNIIYIYYNNKYYQRSDVGLVNIKWFGAKGDYDPITKIGTDDTLAFKKMMATGLPWYIPESNGSYLISDTISITADGTCDGIIHTITDYNDVAFNFTGITYGIKRTIKGLNVKATTVRVSGSVGILIEYPSLVLDRCVVQSMDYGIQVCSYSVALMNCHSFMCKTNVSAFAPQASQEINDLKIIGGTYDSATEYSCRIGDPRFTTTIPVGNPMGSTILIEGASFDGATSTFDRVLSLSLQSCYWELPLTGKAIELGGSGDNILRVVDINGCYFTRVRYAIYCLNSILSLRVRPNYYGGGIYCALYYVNSHASGFNYTSGYNTTPFVAKEVHTGYGFVSTSQLLFSSISISKDFIDSGVQIAPFISSTSQWYPNGSTSDNKKNITSAYGRFYTNPVVGVAGNQVGSIFTCTTISDCYVFNGGDRISGAGGSTFIRFVDYDLGIIYVDGNLTGASTISQIIAVFRHVGISDVTAPTTGSYIVGDKVYLSAPTTTGYIGFVCTTAGTPGTWIPFGKIGIDVGKLGSGTTANRPVITTIGYEYFDTTLGKPIWWNGTVWKDATGTTV